MTYPVSLRVFDRSALLGQYMRDCGWVSRKNASRVLRGRFRLGYEPLGLKFLRSCAVCRVLYHQVGHDRIFSGPCLFRIRYCVASVAETAAVSCCTQEPQHLVQIWNTLDCRIRPRTRDRCQHGSLEEGGKKVKTSWLPIAADGGMAVSLHEFPSLHDDPMRYHFVIHL
jgi:hypothetical protein